MLGDVALTDLAAGQLLSYDGTEWVNAEPTGDGADLSNFALKNFGYASPQNPQTIQGGSLNLYANTTIAPQLTMRGYIVSGPATAAYASGTYTCNMQTGFNIVIDLATARAAGQGTANISVQMSNSEGNVQIIVKQTSPAVTLGTISSNNGMIVWTAGPPVMPTTDGAVIVIDIYSRTLGVPQVVVGSWSLGTAGGGGGATALSGLSDVTLTSPTAGQYLTWNGSAWINYTGSQIFTITLTPPLINSVGPAGTMSSSSAISISGTGATAGNVLTWNGSAWGPAAPSGGGDVLLAADNAFTGNNTFSGSSQTFSGNFTYFTTGNVAIGTVGRSSSAISWLASGVSWLVGASANNTFVIGRQGTGSNFYMQANGATGELLVGSAPTPGKITVNGPIVATGLPSIQTLSDVGAMTPTTGDVLSWNGTRWASARATQTTPLAFVFPGPMALLRMIVVPVATPITIPANLAGSVYFNNAGSASTNVFELYGSPNSVAPSWTLIGTVTTVSATTASFAGAGGSVPAGGVLMMRYATSPADATLAEVGITILATGA
jgi:hypothetical protein